MKIIIETQEKELVEYVRLWEKYHHQAHIVFDEGEGQTCHRSDEEIAEAVERMLREFAVKAQWVAIYRVLVDFYGFPSGYRDFSKRIGRMMPRYGGRLACDEQTIQKGIMAHPVLTKHYEKWLAYEPKDGERSVARQKHTAMRFLRLLDDRTLR